MGLPTSAPADDDPIVMDDDIEGVTITGQREVLSPLLDAVEYYRLYCYEANRLYGHSAPPVLDSDWVPLDEAGRAQFKIFDPEVPAFSLTDAVRETTLLIKFESLPQQGGLVENRCTMAILGGRDHDYLRRQIAAVFGSAGTRRHIGQADGSPKVKGWEQWLWTGMPGRHSKRWRDINAEGRGANRGTWLVVTDLRFYTDHDYIMGDLKIRQYKGQPLSMLTFSYITRAGQRN